MHSVSKNDIRKKHKQVFDAIFARPVQSGIAWRDIETMLEALGAEVSERRGSRICISLNKVDAVFHRPHPRKEASISTVLSLRRFLEAAGVKKYEL